MRFPSLTITKSADGELEVSADGFRTGHLCLDEALGCVASALYGDANKLPQFMSSNLQNARTRRRYGQALDLRDVAALRSVGEPIERCGACDGRGDVKTGEDGTFMPKRQDCAVCCGRGWVG